MVDQNLILVWTDAERRIITGADLLGQLLRRIARTAGTREATPAPHMP